MTTQEESMVNQKLNRLCAVSKARELWATFTDNQKHGVRFGLFPAHEMLAAEKELVESEIPARDAGRLLAVALMGCAKNDGGMCA